MPDVSVSQQTQDRLTEEATANVKKTKDEMFENPNVKLEVKPIAEIPMDRDGNTPQVNTEEVKTIEDAPKRSGNEGVSTPPINKKKKKALTQKQLDALAKGRETSMRNRQAKAKQLKEQKAEASNKPPPKQVHYQEPPPMPNPRDNHMGLPPPPQQIYQQTPIDYDKIINGVADIYQQRERQKHQATLDQEKANNDVAMFEEQIRNDERIKLMAKFEKQEKEKVKAKALKTTASVYNRQPTMDQSNPYAYAFNMNSRNNFKRY